MAPRSPLRSWLPRALLVVATLATLVAVLAGYARREVLTEGRFADRAVQAVRADAVRDRLGTELAARLTERDPQLISAQPAIESAARSVLGSEAAGGLISRAAIDLHRTVLNRDGGSIVVNLANLDIVVREFLRTSSPDVAASLRPTGPDLSTALADGTLAGPVVRAASRVSFVAIVAPLLALVAFLASVGLSPPAGRRRAIARVGVALLIAGGLVFVLQSAATTFALEAITDADRPVVAGVLDACFGSLVTWCAALGLLGSIIVASAGALLGPVDPLALPRRALALMTSESASSTRKLLRALTMIFAGALIVGSPSAALTIVATIVGAFLVVLGLTAILQLAGVDAFEPVGARSQRRRSAVLAGLGGAVVLALAVFAVQSALSSGANPASLPAADGTACNGSAALCDRRIDQVVFPSTHNSNSSAAAGYLNANHGLSMVAQLDLGIRGLLIDTVKGQTTGNGRVRTDLAGETRATIVDQIGESGLAAAERLAGSIAFGPLTGETQAYLCHVMCEAGSTPAVEGLQPLRDWLVGHPREVLVIFVQDDAPAAMTKAAFKDSGLTELAFQPQPGAPLPTLRQMIRSGKRVFLMAENNGDASGWYQRGFNQTQDTLYRFDSVAETRKPAACELNRGVPTSPLLLVNHWIETYPPNPRNADPMNEKAELLNRARRCAERRDRTPNLLAIDFAERGDIIEAAATLNQDPIRP